MVLSKDEYDFVNRVLRELPLPLADRKQDRLRQRLRKLGLVEVIMNPRRWVVTVAGIEAHLKTDVARGRR